MLIFYIISFGLSDYRFGYTPINTSFIDNFWIYPSRKQEFVFHLFDEDVQLSEDREKSLISSGVLPVIYGSDTDTVENAEIEPNFNSESWNFFFIAKKPGTFCFKIKANINTGVLIADSHLCFAVSYFLTNGRQCILGQINSTHDINSKIFDEEGGIKYFHEIQSFPLSLFSTFIIEMENKVTSPFFASNITLISPNDFVDSYYISYDFSVYPEIISEITNICVQPDNNIFIQAGCSSLRIHVDQTYDILDNNADIAFVGCDSQKCNYMFYTKNENIIYFYQIEGKIDLEPEEQIICGSFASKSPEYLVVVTQINNSRKNYRIRSITLSQGIITNQTYEYLKEEPNYEVFSTPKIVVPSLSFNPSNDPIIVGIHSHQNQDENIYIYGSSLVYSPSSGNGWYLMASFQPYKIVDFTSSPTSGKFAFRTNDPEHTLYFGSVGNKLFSRLSLRQFIRNEYSIEMNDYFDFVRLYFSSEDTLYLIKFDKVTANVERLIIPIENTRYDESECPYFACSINSDNNIGITRELDVVDFPERIYLDHNDQYNFNMLFSKKKNSSPQVNLKGRSLLQINQSIINDNLSDTVDLYVNISENKEVIANSPQFGYNSKMRPGEYIAEVPIIISVMNSSPRCSFSQASIMAHIGCPYGFIFEIDPTATMCKKDPDIQCPDYSQRWYPRFRLRDSLDNSSRPYNGMFDLKIIGYGEYRDSMYIITNQSDLYEFNYGSKPMWGYDSSLRTGVASNSNGTIIWLCAEGSPCARVNPNFPDTPKIYLRFHVDTNISFDNSTYCAYETTFDICLSSLPFPFAYQMATIIVTLFICVLLNLIRYYKFFKNYSSSTLTNIWKKKKSTKKKKLILDIN
ncbi:hypothetical protein M9Y10_044900 [Tritrichomonas musculus]|uniref:CATSPERG C-terminal domain-containing protein n=1 Tax=Tritrichomonas musculus TaxID=1915356 RepID=A0ABR2JUV8_9EUKA